MQLARWNPLVEFGDIQQRLNQLFVDKTEDGVLYVFLPKAPTAKPKVIDVKVA